MFKWIFILSLAALFTSSDRAFAYNSFTHKVITEKAFEGERVFLDTKLHCATDYELDQFRKMLYRNIIEKCENTLAYRFKLRYPTLKDFDVFGFRDFLGFSQNLKDPIMGIDRVECSGVTTVRETLVAASVQPDEDFRNMNRFAYDRNRKPILNAAGEYIPRDPAILNMGNAQGLSSQAHAHYYLPPLGLSSDLRTLITNPARFVIPAGFGEVVETFGSDMAEMHAALSILASSAPFKGAEYLKYLFMGQAMHYLQDLSLPLHTVQIGTRSFVFRSLFNYFSRAIVTFGGMFGEFLSFGDYGINLIKNYHLATEGYIDDYIREFTQRNSRSEKKEVRANSEIFAKSDHEIIKWLDWQDQEYLDSDGGYIKALAIKTALLSSYEGELLYELAYQLFCPELRRYDFVLENGEFELDDQYNCFSKDPKKIRTFNEVINNSFRRASTSVRLLKEHIESKSGAGQHASYVETLNRLVRNRLDYLDAADARLEIYLQQAEPSQQMRSRVNIPWFLIQTALILFIVAFTIYSIRKFFTKKTSA